MKKDDRIYMNRKDNKKKPFFSFIDEISLDQFLMIISLFGVFVFLYFLYDDSWINNFYNNEKRYKIGKVSKLYKDVRRRTVNDFVWLPLNDFEAVFIGDSIYTGNKSSALVNLDIGVSLWIDPDSLVVLDPSSDTIKLDLKFGNLKGNLGNNSSKVLKLNINQQDLQIDGKSVEFTIEKKSSAQTNLKIIEGVANITETKSKKKIQVLKRQFVKIDRNTASIDPITKFEENIEFVRKEQWGINRNVWLNIRQPLSFTWQTEGPVDHFEILISNNPEMKSLLVSEKTKINGFTWTPPMDEGLIYWQIKAFKNKSDLNPVISERVSWKLGLLTAPEWTDTLNPKIISINDIRLNEVSKNISSSFIRWKSNLKTNNFKLEWARDPSFKEKASSDLKVNQKQLSSLVLGRYFFRVRSENIGRPASLWSDTLIVDIIDKDPEGLIEPQLATTEIETLEKTGSYQIEWAPQEKTQNYLVEVSEIEDFSKIKFSVSLKNKLQWNVAPQRLGRYYLRIVPLGEKGRHGPASKVIVWNVRRSAPIWSYKQNFLQIQIPRGQDDKLQVFPETTLRWTVQDKKIKEYELKSSNDADFKNSKLEKSSVTQFKLNSLSTGTYFYTVRGIYHDGSLTMESTPLKIDVVEQSSDGLISPRFLTQILPSELEGDKAAVAQFKWEKQASVEKYKIQLSKYNNFERVEVDKVITGLQYQLSAYDIGNYYIRVAGISKKSRVGPWSEVLNWSIKTVKPLLAAIDPISLILPNNKSDIPLTYATIRWSAPKSQKKFQIEFNEIIGKDKSSIIGSDENKQSRREAGIQDGLFGSKFTKIVTGNKFKIQVFRSANYTVKVKAISDSQQDLSSYSNEQILKIAIKRPLVRPTLMVPKNKISYLLSKLKNPEIWLQWTSDENANEYQIQVAKDSNFKKILLTIDAYENRKLLDHNSIKGKVHWRVKGTNKELKLESPWSEPWSLSVVDIENEE